MDIKLFARGGRNLSAFGMVHLRITINGLSLLDGVVIRDIAREYERQQTGTQQKKKKSRKREGSIVSNFSPAGFGKA